MASDLKYREQLLHINRTSTFFWLVHEITAYFITFVCAEGSHFDGVNYDSRSTS